MATRATYEVDGQVFYCHWDGYPAGAASRFANMIAALTAPETAGRHEIDAIAERRGGAAFAFIRGNLDAEPAHRGKHDGHGDTEFRYQVETHQSGAMTVRLEARSYNGEWKGFGPAQPLAEFINAKRDKEWDVPTIVVCEAGSACFRRTMLATADSAREIAAAHQRLADKFDDSNPNRKSHLEQAAAWRAAAEQAEPQAVEA